MIIHVVVALMCSVLCNCYRCAIQLLCYCYPVGLEGLIGQAGVTNFTIGGSTVPATGRASGPVQSLKFILLEDVFIFWNYFCLFLVAGYVLHALAIPSPQDLIGL